MTRPPRRRALFALACVLAVGCLGAPAPRDRSYRLELAPPAPRAQTILEGTLEVERLNANALVRGTALVYVAEPSSRELRTRAYDHWVDSPTLLVQREIAAYLRAAAVADRVVTPELGSRPDHWLRGELVRFEEVRGGGAPRVVVEIALALVDERRGGILLQKSYREERAVEGPDAEDAVRAYDVALEAVLSRLVGDLAELR